MNSGINGKVVAITGASSGIGEATALLLAGKGAKIVVGARRTERLGELVAKIKAKGGEALWITTDVTKSDHLLKLVELACTQFGRLDVMINNAGIGHLGRIDEGSVADWEDMIDVNFRGVLYGIAAAMPVFKKQNSGHIINIISTSGIKITPLQGVYAGTKNAVRTLAESMRQESNGNLRITGVSPGLVQTEMVSSMKDSDIKKAILSRANQIALSPDAIARAVAFAIEQPADVEIGDIVIRPAAQD